MHFSSRLRTCLSLLLALAITIFPAAALAATPAPTATLPPFDSTVPAYDPEHPENLTVDQLYAQSLILINQDDGDVLMEKNADARMNPASTTKIMTCLLALEYGDINQLIIVPDEAAMVPQDSSKVPVTPGEEMSFLDLLYGLMLHSGNDAANAIAVLIAGSVDAFVDMMNDRAAELGCVNTHFVNAHGYTAEGHYTTARDMAIITRAAMQNATFRKIVSSGDYTMGQSSIREPLKLLSSNSLLVYGTGYRYRYATGVKTGTTSAAGQCLVGSATKDTVNLISVVFKSTIYYKDAKFQDTIRLFDYGFSRYHSYSFQELYDNMNLVVPISNVSPDDPGGGTLRLQALLNRSGSYEAVVSDEHVAELMEEFRSQVSVEYTRALTAPIAQGEIIGRLTFTPADGNELTAVLVAERSIEAQPALPIAGFNLKEWLMQTIPPWVLLVVGLAVVLFLALTIARIVFNIRQSRRRKARAKARKRRRIHREFYRY